MFITRTRNNFFVLSANNVHCPFIGFTQHYVLAGGNKRALDKSNTGSSTITGPGDTNKMIPGRLPITSKYEIESRRKMAERYQNQFRNVCKLAGACPALKYSCSLFNVLPDLSKFKHKLN